MKSIFYRFISWCPGAVGLWLRQKVLPSVFESCGKRVLFGRNVNFLSPGNIVLGDRVVLNNNVVLDASRWQHDEPAIILGDDVFIGNGTKVICGASGSVAIRSGSNFSSLCTVQAEHTIEVGENVLVAAYCTLGNGVHEEDTSGMGDYSSQGSDKGSVVGNGCWLGVRMKLMHGVSIGRDTIVGAHAVVETDLPSYAVAVGQPARMIKDRRTD